jgi:hypothetical protein
MKPLFAKLIDIDTCHYTMVHLSHRSDCRPNLSLCKVRSDVTIYERVYSDAIFTPDNTPIIVFGVFVVILLYGFYRTIKSL